MGKNIYAIKAGHLKCHVLKIRLVLQIHIKVRGLNFRNFFPIPRL